MTRYSLSNHFAYWIGWFYRLLASFKKISSVLKSEEQASFHTTKTRLCIKIYTFFGIVILKVYAINLFLKEFSRGLTLNIHLEKSYFLNQTDFFVPTSVFRQIRRKRYIQQFSKRIVPSFECQILNSVI